MKNTTQVSPENTQHCDKAGATYKKGQHCYHVCVYCFLIYQQDLKGQEYMNFIIYELANSEILQA